MALSLLRARVPGQHAAVTYAELFFDLVFVFTITQVSHHLLDHLGWGGALESAVLLLAVWLAWNYTAWITNWLDPNHPLVRLALIGLMAAGLTMAIAIPGAFETRGAAFAAAYLTLQIGRTLLILWATRRDPSLRRNFVRVVSWMAFSGVFWIGGGFLDASQRLAVWGLALGLDYLAPAIGFWMPVLGRSATREWTVEGGHLAERCGLFIMICLGESILATGGAASSRPWTPELLLALAVAFTGVATTWWIYFGVHAQAAINRIAHTADPGRLGVQAYVYGHIPIVAGIVVEAAGDEIVLSHPLAPASLVSAMVLIGGPALFLIGAVEIKRNVFGIWSPSRLTGLALTAVPALIWPWLSNLGLAALAMSILLLVAVWETLAKPTHSL